MLRGDNELTRSSTTTNIYTTLTVTQNLPASRVYTTSTTTPTVTVDSDGPRKAKRAPAPEPTPKAILPRRAQLAQIEAIANVFQAENSTLSGGDIQTEFYTSISSACSCLSQISQWQPLHTLTLTETASTVVCVIASAVRQVLNSAGSQPSCKDHHHLPWRKRNDIYDRDCCPCRYCHPVPEPGPKCFDRR